MQSAAQKITIATAESCTGGRLAAALTAAAGASEYFTGGVVAYSNQVKTNVLGVDAETIAAHGAVSRPTACEMARGVQRLTGADVGISTTGIAGPGGGSAEKPVGTVWIAICAPKFLDKEIAQLHNFAGSRTEIMEQAVEAALGMLQLHLLL